MTEANIRTVVCRIEGIRRHRSTTELSAERSGLDGDKADFEILLSIDESVYLPPSAVDILRTFESVQRGNLYIFLDLGPGNRIQRFGIAHSGFVRRVTRAEEGYYVRLEEAPAAHFIPLRPDPTAMVETILSAQRAHQPVALRTASVCEPTIAAQVVPATPEMVRGSVRIAPYPDLDSLTALNYEEAVECFDILAAFTCPAASEDSCVPTFYIVTGCQARAHRFCHILGGLKRSVRAGKKWAWADFLVVEPPNMPCCHIEFDVHVAVAVRASDREGFYVFDHALFGGPVTEDVWLSKLVNPMKRSAISDASAYLWEDPREPPRKEIPGDTEAALRTARVWQEEMIREYGEPPYDSCFVRTHEAIRGCVDLGAGSGGAAGTPYRPA